MELGSFPKFTEIKLHRNMPLLKTTIKYEQIVVIVFCILSFSLGLRLSD